MNKESTFMTGAMYSSDQTQWHYGVWNISKRYGNKLREKGEPGSYNNSRKVFFRSDFMERGENDGRYNRNTENDVCD